MPSLKISMPSSIRNINNFFRWDQYWNMFAPFPLKNDGWLVVKGKLVNGEQVDPFLEINNPNFEKPNSVSDNYKNTLWRKYITNVWMKDGRHKNRLHFGKYLCRKYNFLTKPIDGEKLKEFEIYYIQEKTRLPGVDFTTDTFHKWHHDCLQKILPGT